MHRDTWTSPAGDGTVLSVERYYNTVIIRYPNTDMFVYTDPAPTKITGYTKHGLKQAMERDGVGVKPLAILDAERNPIELVTEIDGLGRISHAYFRVGAMVVLNPVGTVITTWATSSQHWRLAVK